MGSAVPVPLWVVVMLGLSSPVVAIAALVATEIRERRRLRHEGDLREADREAEHDARLRDERIEAYSTLARLTKAMWLAVPEDPLPNLYAALSQVEILYEDPELFDAAEDLVDTWTTAWEAAGAARSKGGSVFDAPDFKDAESQLVPLRNAFVQRAKVELGIERRSREVEGGPSNAAVSGPETEALER